MIYLDAWKPPESTRPSYSRRLPANMMKLAAHRVTGFGTRTRPIHMGSFFAISSKFSRRRYGRVYFCKNPVVEGGNFFKAAGLQYNPKIAQRTAGVEIRAFLQSKMQC